MKFIYSILLTCTLSHASISIKVLLAEYTAQPVTFQLEAGEHLCFSTPTANHVKEKQGTITVHQQALVGKNYSIPLPVMIHAAEKKITINKKTYEGCIILYPSKNGFYLINKIDLESYVHSVLKSESWLSWPLETHKLMAVTCRTYALYTLLESKKAGLPYHIKCSNHHQTYEGAHTDTKLSTAVQETEGIVMSFEGKPILAMFDICCGGIVPAHVHHIKTHQKKYLSRTAPCTFCKDLKVATWQARLPKKAFIEALQSHFSHLKYIKHLKVTKRDKAGLVQELMIHDGRKALCISGKKLYSLLKEIKSYWYDIQHHGEDIILDGKGFGHHVGLCQWGAHEMIKSGYSFKETLLFYYPGIKFMKLNKKELQHNAEL